MNRNLQAITPMSRAEALCMLHEPPPLLAERAERITRLIEERFMTPDAAARVVDAAMFGIGCAEGKVREAQQERLDKGLPASLPS